MAGFNNQSIHESYTFNILSDQVYSIGMDSDHTDSIMDSDYATGYPVNQTVNNNPNATYFYPPSSQVFSPPDIGSFNNNVYTNANSQLNTNTAACGHNGSRIDSPTSPTAYNLTGYSLPAIYYPPHEVFTPSTSTFANNNIGITTNAMNNGVIIIIKADINLEKLLSIIQ